MYLPSEVLDDMAKNAFLDALTDYDFKIKVACCNPHNINEALTHALRLEALLTADPSKKAKRVHGEDDRYVRNIADVSEASAGAYDFGPAKQIYNRNKRSNVKQFDRNLSFQYQPSNVSDFQGSNVVNVSQNAPNTAVAYANQPILSTALNMAGCVDMR